MFAAKSSAWHVPFTPTYLCKLQYFSCGRDTEKRLITIALVESAIPAKIYGGDPQRNICPVVARLRFHFPSSPRPTSFFLFFSSSFSFLFFLFHFSRGLLLFHGEIGRCSFIDSLQSTDLLFAYEWITIRTFLFSFFFFFLLIFNALDTFTIFFRHPRQIFSSCWRRYFYVRLFSFLGFRFVILILYFSSRIKDLSLWICEYFLQFKQYNLLIFLFFTIQYKNLQKCIIYCIYLIIVIW